MGLENLFDKIKDLITGGDANEEEQNVRPASEDPLGDPADQEGRRYPSQDRGAYQGGVPSQDIAPASEDPRGDPADQEQGILPASQDPLGDPADQGR